MLRQVLKSSVCADGTLIIQRNLRSCIHWAGASGLHPFSKGSDTMFQECLSELRCLSPAHRDPNLLPSFPRPTAILPEPGKADSLLFHLESDRISRQSSTSSLCPLALSASSLRALSSLCRDQSSQEKRQNIFSLFWPQEIIASSLGEKDQGRLGMEGWGLLSSITILPQFSKLLGSINDWNQLQVMSLSGHSCTHPLPAGISPTALSGRLPRAYG